ncbi:hypothetical protein FH972_026472 [Carpinus fangiana]|uniref:DUF159 domain protein n=1 Tax=Carpinus fangiana TaxID=176857 RepID=A0A5N6L4K3_9ROSI|nr:hypothetical protein FH972_026472 [Carpinus fangiana]
MELLMVLQWMVTGASINACAWRTPSQTQMTLSRAGRVVDSQGTSRYANHVTAHEPCKCYKAWQKHEIFKMCGRYALALRPYLVRQYLGDSNMPSQEAPDDDDPHLRQSYNFAPGYYGLVYRADVPDYGAGSRPDSHHDKSDEASAGPSEEVPADNAGDEPRYKIQAMQWGLIPFWTKRNPGFGSMMKTINCRDDSLATSGGMWSTMKQRKRCIVVAQGFYEWLKKDGGKTKIPHYTKRKDGQLMCFAGLWDCVQYEDAKEKLYTYTIITTDSNKQLNFLHDRMPVILENGSKEMFTWLDSSRAEWSKELQQLLKPYSGELECYPVSSEVGKVGNNSPSFIIPIDSTQNKQNIANFFGNQKKKSEGGKDVDGRQATDIGEAEVSVVHQPGETRATASEDAGDSNAPKPIAGTKRGRGDEELDQGHVDGPTKSQKTLSPSKSPSKSTPTKKSRSATSNNTKSPATNGDGSKKITSFFQK